MDTVQTREVTAQEVAVRIKRSGIGFDELVKITIDPDRGLIPGRREARSRVVAAALTDDDIDRLIKRAQQDNGAEAGSMKILVDTSILVGAGLKNKSLPCIKTCASQRGSIP